MSHIAGLPPMPDPYTGDPRPPRAPLEPGWKGPEDKRAGGENKVPAPPEGEGPILEWFYPTRGHSVTIGFVIAAIVFILYVIRDWGFGWMSEWVLWLFIVPWPFIFLITGRNLRISAGADWLRYGRYACVKTYELTSVKIKVEGAARALHLSDTHGRSLSAQLNDLQMNRELWDLVYNGILHSVRGNNAETNKLARQFLELDNPLRFRGW